MPRIARACLAVAVALVALLSACDSEDGQQQAAACAIDAGDRPDAQAFDDSGMAAMDAASERDSEAPVPDAADEPDGSDERDAATQRDAGTEPDACAPQLETCNDADDDCDGTIDEMLTTRCWLDVDGDGFAAQDASFEYRCGACEPGETARRPVDADIDCDDDVEEIYPAAPEPCGAVDYNCNGALDEACICTPGVVRRNAHQEHLGDCDRCDDDQTWITADADCAYPADVCDVEPSSLTYGECIANPIYDLGMVGDGTTYSLFNDQILALPIDVVEDVTLLEFGMRSTPDSVGGNAYMALYTDLAGEPSELVNRSAEFGIAADSENRHPRASGMPQDIQLSAGRYWIVAKISEGGGSDARLYVGSGPPADNFRSGTQTYGFPSAMLAPGATGVVTGRVSVFIQVQRN